MLMMNGLILIQFHVLSNMFNNLSRIDLSRIGDDNDDNDDDTDSFFLSICIIINDLNHIHICLIIYNNNQYNIVKAINDILSFTIHEIISQFFVTILPIGRFGNYPINFNFCTFNIFLKQKSL